MKEADIRPQDIFNEYLRLSDQDAKTYFVSKDRVALPCVACGAGSAPKAFQKAGFDYVHCPKCFTLYQSPRPPITEFEKFYTDSPSSNYWATRFFPAMMENRRNLIFAPRVKRIDSICQEMKISTGTLIDVGAGYGIFLEEWGKLHPKTKLKAVEPGRKLAEVCQGKGIEVLEKLAEDATDWAGQADLAICFEVIEHAHDPLTFVRAIHNLVKPGGYAIVSGLGVDGFDIQVLWESSKSVSPPHHINFLSVKGFETLFKRAGFREVHISTPGQLDVDIVRNASKEKPGLIEGNRFIRTLLDRGPDTLAAFQEFLSKHQLSSHTWVVARR